MKKNYYGQTILCRTENRGNQIPGRIFFSKEKIDVKLVGFENFVYFRDSQIIQIQLEDNQYCTIAPFSISPGSSGSAYGRCHFLNFSASEAIIGFRPWTESDRIKELYFSLSDTNGLLESPDIKRKITSSKIGEELDGKIIEASCGGITVTISYTCTMSLHDDNYSVSGVHGHVVFENPKSTSELSQFTAALGTFFTMAAGITVRTSDYWISSEKNSEQRVLGGGTAPALFQLIWPREGTNKNNDSDRLKPTSILSCFDEAGRKSTSDCLNFWIDKWDTWKPAFQGLYLATLEGSFFDTNRIINACKWLESTPGAQQLRLDNAEQLEKISKAATSKASELGLDVGPRIFGAIQQLGTESRNELFKRLIAKAVKKGGVELRERFRKDLHAAFRIRGGFAHSKFEHLSNEDFGDYVRGTQAVEALAFLLLYQSLPLPDDHFWGHRPHFTEYLRQ